MRKVLFPLLSLAILVFTSCDPDEQVQIKKVVDESPAEPYFYENGGYHLPGLGRMLFYDRQLSVNNSISCASCHKQAFAFGDNTSRSVGFDNGTTSRNSMSIQNISIHTPRLFWDGRESDLRTMILQPIVNHVEMGMPDIDQLVGKLSGLPYYTTLFKDAYGTPEITADRIALALITFISNIKSDSTVFDRSRNGGPRLSSLEKEGAQLFQSKYNCVRCHQVEQTTLSFYNGSIVGAPLSVGFANVGLDLNYSDNGLAMISGATTENGFFRIPSLRNVALTAPYMHDGRFETLEQVIDHYSEGIQLHPNLDPQLKTAVQNGGFQISDSEKMALVAFLHTLTDMRVITDPRFSDPFK